MKQQENKEIKKHLSSCLKNADKYYYKNHQQTSAKLAITSGKKWQAWQAQLTATWLKMKKDCERKFQEIKLPMPDTSQNQMDNELITKPSFIRELLSGLDDRDFQLRSQNQAIKKAIDRANQDHKKQYQAILKRVGRLERQVKRSKYSKNLKKERSSSS